MLNKEIAYTDNLTNLYNRYYINKYVESKMYEESKSMSIAILDIDNFKRMTDLYGSEFRDAALVMVATKIKEQINKEVITGRFGEDEFIFIFLNQEFSQVKTTIERIQKCIKQMVVECNGLQLKITISIGCMYSYPFKENKNIANMIKETTNLLYLAKSKGKDCVVIKKTQTEN